MDDFMQNFLYEKPTYNSVTDSLIIYSSYGNGYSYVEAMSEDIFVTPKMNPSPLYLEPPEIIRSNNFVNQRVDWKSTFEINNADIPTGGYLTITAP